jgi:DNA polymerase IV (DinB-like DNA polymerase)
MPRIIAHLDMDAFFAAIEERDHEWLRGKPIVVGADPKGGIGRGVVSTANYKAREYGIRSAMPISRAWQLSEEARKKGKPSAEFLSTNFGRYEETSGRIMSLIRANRRIVEEASIDEAYFDLSDLVSYEEAIRICGNLKAEVFKKEKLTCSIGIGPNKLIAKIASDMQKPDGLTVVGTDDKKTCLELVERFLEPLPIRKIPGIGPKSEKEFSLLGIKKVVDLKKLSREECKKIMGKWGSDLYNKIRGTDESPVTEEYEAKSIGEQETFEKDASDSGFILERLKELCEGVVDRFEASEFASFRTVAITVRFGDFQTVSRAKTLEKPARDFNRLYFEALRLIAPFLDKRENPRRKPIRLIGVRIEKLVA